MSFHSGASAHASVWVLRKFTGSQSDLRYWVNLNNYFSKPWRRLDTTETGCLTDKLIGMYVFSRDWKHRSLDRLAYHCYLPNWGGQLLPLLLLDLIRHFSVAERLCHRVWGAVLVFEDKHFRWGVGGVDIPQDIWLTIIRAQCQG